MRHIPRVARLTLALCACAAWAAAQNPVGSEFPVNNETTGRQIVPRIAMDVSGRFTIVWQDGDLGRIELRRFKADGAPDGLESTVAAGAINRRPDISCNAAGNMAVVWSDSGVDGQGFGVLAKRISASGGQGLPFRVNTFTSGHQMEPAVAVAPDGNALVSWATQDDNFGIDARLISASGQPGGTQELTVSTTSATMQRNPAVAYQPGVNRYVIAWSLSGVPYTAIKARFVTASGQATVGPEFQVSSEAYPHNQAYPTVASDANGNFVVVWAESFPFLIKFRRFDYNGMALANDYTIPASGNAFEPRIDMTEQGDFVIAWYEDIIPFDSHAMRFSANGTPIGSAFLVNSYTTSIQRTPAVAMTGTGDFVATWSSNTQDGSQEGIYAKRFGTLRAAGLAVDSAANGVWDRNEAAGLTPSWTNLTNSTQGPVTGTLSALTCPGFSCWINDDTASYTIPANQTAPCRSGPCYQVENTAGIGAPTGHNDATALETLGTGEQKTWKLHIGESFTDVPKLSSVYRYVETVLHRAITGGCGSGIYCPNNSSTREQMPVFVLVAKEGAGYAPPPCTTPVFNDVPASSPFCRWIEELWRRGVVSGCGGGSYCPTSPVTRAQMMVFGLRTLDPSLNPPACTTPPFNDVPINDPFCRWIKEALARGITNGMGNCSPGNFCPGDPITRGDMALVITKTFDLTLYGL